jgi:hypothetical protein
MALLFERTPSCAQIVLDTADIVRDGDFSTPTVFENDRRGIRYHFSEEPIGHMHKNP